MKKAQKIAGQISGQGIDSESLASLGQLLHQLGATDFLADDNVIIGQRIIDDPASAGGLALVAEAITPATLADTLATLMADLASLAELAETMRSLAADAAGGHRSPRARQAAAAMLAGYVDGLGQRLARLVSASHHC